jgi:hypothetical protein
MKNAEVFRVPRTDHATFGCRECQLIRIQLTIQTRFGGPQHVDARGRQRIR